MKTERIWVAAALILFAAALAASLQTVLTAPRHREILARKAADLRRIEAHAGRWAREEAYRDRLEALEAWRPPALEPIATRALGSGVARFSPRPAEPAADGWQRREVSVEIASAPYAEVAVFLAAAAEAAPAWRLREMEIRPSAEPGTGAMTVVLEALEKKLP
jgi:hypothetical protein